MIKFYRAKVEKERTVYAQVKLVIFLEIRFWLASFERNMYNLQIAFLRLLHEILAVDAKHIKLSTDKR